MVETEFENPANPAFLVKGPAQQRVPFVFNSPHSGCVYPSSLINSARLSAHELRGSEDVLVDELFASVVAIGAPLVAAQFPRVWLDVNREPFELDPLLFRERLPAHANVRSLRVAGGLGTIARLVREDVPIYKHPPSLEEAQNRIEKIYKPYHSALRSLIGETARQFGHCVLVDCHSMPSSQGRRAGKVDADIVIGDRYGTSCDGAISRELCDRFTALGYRVSRNKPYAGGFITEHYGRPLKGLHAVQIEINRALYMDEKTLLPHDGFAQLQLHISRVISHLVSMPDSGLSPVAEAAE